ncbi:MAG: hypothetical protein WBA97_06245 [Actinophytocola sp.]|uniref:hypothetical protein n=1 Tax=Actinophytocola sp. TaxID=1872138 RepID=UPI003C73FF0E
MNSRRVALAVAAASVFTATVFSPTVSSAEPQPAPSSKPVMVAGMMAHVNSDVEYTWLYDSAYGDAHGETKLFRCFNFLYDYTSNGRYHAYALNGFISMDRAGSGWCD